MRQKTKTQRKQRGSKPPTSAPRAFGGSHFEKVVRAIIAVPKKELDETLQRERRMKPKQSG